jgi:hypothetical protein
MAELAAIVGGGDEWLFFLVADGDGLGGNWRCVVVVVVKGWVCTIEVVCII